MLEIQDLQNLAVNGIVDLLVEEGAQPIEIAIPKETQLFFSESQAIAIDYAELAYAGQRLKDISTSFAYTKVPPETTGAVIFTIAVPDFERLAATLLEISYGYVNDPEDEEFIYEELVEDFLYQVEKSAVVPACPYFIDVYNEYLVEGEEE